jgi:hypothetical protein
MKSRLVRLHVAYARYIAKKRKYEPRIFVGRVMTPADLERVHREMLGFQRIEAVSDKMRALIDELRPELVHKAVGPARRRCCHRQHVR